MKNHDEIKIPENVEGRQKNFPLKNNKLIEKNKSISEYPEEIIPIEPGTTITIGDLHGNTLKLVRFLIENRILELDEQAYQYIREIYEKDDLTQDDLARFDEIINNANFNKTKTPFILIGDELGDRGKNDYLTLKVFQKLHEKGVPFEVTFSNHGEEFIVDYEKRFLNLEGSQLNPVIAREESQSLHALRDLVDNRVVGSEEISSLIENFYYPHLQLLTYRLSEDGENITVFSHARINLSVIQGMCEKLGIEYKDNTAKELADTIDCMNEKFSHYKDNKEIHTLRNPGNPGLGSPLKSSEMFFRDDPNRAYKEFALECFASNRDDALDPEFLRNLGLNTRGLDNDLSYSIDFVHGHTPPKRPNGEETEAKSKEYAPGQFVHNADNFCAKDDNNPKYFGEYRDEDRIIHSSGLSPMCRNLKKQLIELEDILDQMQEEHLFFKATKQLTDNANLLQKGSLNLKDKELLTDVVRLTNDLVGNNLFPQEALEAKINRYEQLMHQVEQKSEKSGTGLGKKILGWMGMILGAAIFLAAALALTAFLVTTFPVSLPTVTIGGTLLATLLTTVSTAISTVGVGSVAGVGAVGLAGFIGGFFCNKKGVDSNKAQQWHKVSDSMKEIKEEKENQKNFFNLALKIESE